MPLDLLDSTTWEASTLETPEGPITYWVLADLEEYYEQYVTDGSMTKVQIAVAWADAITFKWYSLGWAERPGGASQTFLQRYTPLECPIQEKQYLVDLKKRKVVPGVDQTVAQKYGNPIYARADATLGNWFTLPETTGVPPRIVYDATFATLPYEVLDQDTFTAGDSRELQRFVTPTAKSNPRERKAPTFSFELDAAPNTPIPEVGFIPYYDETHVLTWHAVPWNLVPWTAINSRLLKINDSAFGYKNDGTWGRWRTGSLRFDGLASEVRPYRAASGQRVVDLPYVFTHQRGDDTDNTHWKIPVGTEWKLIRRRGSAGADADRLYLKATFDNLFQPEPA